MGLGGLNRKWKSEKNLWGLVGEEKSLYFFTDVPDLPLGKVVFSGQFSLSDTLKFPTREYSGIPFRNTQTNKPR